MESLFSQIERQDRLSDRVQAQIQQVIVGNKLKPGEKLPTERELAERLGVSRTVIREACRSLAAKGLLEVRTGSGTFVRHPSHDDVTESMNLLIRTQIKDNQHIYEVRRVLEVEIAGLATLRATDDDLAQLKDSVERIKAKDLTAERFADEDVGFHATLARATQNPLFSIMLNSIIDVLREVRLLGFTKAKAQVRAAHFHALIYKCVSRGDEQAARRAMSDHLDESIATMTEAINKQTESTAPPS